MLKQKIAVVTGAGRGIGRGIAISLAKQGASIVVASAHLDNARKVAAEIEAIGNRALAVKADVSSEKEIENMFACGVEKFGRVDILVNNAGIVHSKPLLEITPEDWDIVMGVNLKGVFLCCQAVFPIMIKQGWGRIINIASISGKRGGGVLGDSCYTASKGGVIAFTKAIAREGAPYGINVNAITPGYILTDISKGLSQESREALLRTIPLGRAGRPEDIAGAVCYLCSSWADYVTGEIMDVDGGLMMD